jgi:hypothetical protein
VDEAGLHHAMSDCEQCLLPVATSFQAAPRAPCIPRGVLAGLKTPIAAEVLAHLRALPADVGIKCAGGAMVAHAPTQERGPRFESRLAQTFFAFALVGLGVEGVPLRKRTPLR